MEGQKPRATRRQIGQYVLTERIGAGSFAVVYKAKHLSRGHVVAIKEIITDCLHEKLIQGLYSEIQILQKISHPNIVRLHDIVPASDRIFLVLEYCAGGDLAAYIQQHKRVSQAVARKIMKQLGAGLEVLRANNLIHRDLKPQNLLLSTANDNAVLKIADFGFARSLQPQGLAETHCGSPLYMAPEILQYQKYDAKADLWSVGAILYQLVTGHPPFSGSSHVQLMKNIRKTLHFPGSVMSELHPDCIDLCRKLLCLNPVERLSFEEFFNHPFIQAERLERSLGHVAEASSAPLKHGETESLPPFADHQGEVPDKLPSSTCSQQLKCIQMPMISGDAKCHYLSTKDSVILALSPPKQNLLKGTSKNCPVEFRQSGVAFTQRTSTREGEDGYMWGAASRGGTLMDSLESIEREYVLVNTPLTPTDMVLTLSGGEKCLRGECSSQAAFPYSRVPGPAVTIRGKSEGLLDAQPFADPTGSKEPSDVPVRAKEVSNCAPVRLASLQQCAGVIADLAMEKSHAGQPLAAFSLHLVCLSIWREALHVCHTWAAAAAAGERIDGLVEVGANDSQESPLSCCAAVEQEYVAACEQGEILAAHLSGMDAHDGVPDAIELIFQAALAAARNAAVGEVLGNVSKSSVVYARAASLFHFLLQEAPLLPLKPPFVLTTSQRSQLSEIAYRIAERQAKCVANKLTDTG